MRRKRSRKETNKQTNREGKSTRECTLSIVGERAAGAFPFPSRAINKLKAEFTTSSLDGTFCLGACYQYLPLALAVFTEPRSWLPFEVSTPSVAPSPAWSRLLPLILLCGNISSPTSCNIYCNIPASASRSPTTYKKSILPSSCSLFLPLFSTNQHTRTRQHSPEYRHDLQLKNTTQLPQQIYLIPNLNYSNCSNPVDNCPHRFVYARTFSARLPHFTHFRRFLTL